MRAILATALGVLLLAPPALAQQQGEHGAAKQQMEDTVKRAPGAQLESDAQGTRPGTPTDTPTASSELQQALERVWNSAVDLQGVALQGVSSLSIPQGRGEGCMVPPGQPCPTGGLAERP